ncbi:FAD-binding oxidoreductase [Desulfonema ishimotonii]|uniref:FAD-binding oxidoreductase n=1 Tax=Desulfonema ishimotonii TaxID=45657 RepID=A0A401FT27_9BACT|nr:FAD-linked oxidase C-terminal domain-containing protein [Desulfonema ishimotonii]GBC60127.1 FAD-binding oxidoreductase [Desulfonema ishimotonii]
MSSKTLITEFETLLGTDNVISDESGRMSYAYDAAVLEPVLPEVVLRPTTGETLGETIRLCNENNMPVTVRGAGTNLSGGTIPESKGAVVLTNGFNKILEINREDMYAVVQPGVVTAKFAAAVQEQGLFYPPDPGSQAVSTLGGNVAENAGGLRGLKYGVTKDYVMGVDFFDPAGNLIRSGSRTVKSVTGMNLSSLMIGSEGSLGVFNEIILKLVPPPATHRAMMAIYDSVSAASETVAAIIASQIIPCTLEFMDNVTIRAVEDFAHVGLPTDARALLLIEVDGHPAQVAEEAAQVEEICRKMGAVNIRTAKDDAERNSIWEARRAALSALARMRPTTVLEDATVPRSKIPHMVRAVEDIAEKYNLTIGTFGHAGDGNLHPTIMTDRRDKNEWLRVEKAIEDIFDVALSFKGTLSGEHGIGLAKAGFMAKEVGEATLDYCRKMKAALDPKGTLNPGKIIGR